MARVYGAVCTPDFFGFTATGDFGITAALMRPAASRPALTRAVDVRGNALVAPTGVGPHEQMASIGCSIASAWDKALYYFSSVNTDYDNVWIVEEDVFVSLSETIPDIPSSTQIVVSA